MKKLLLLFTITVFTFATLKAQSVVETVQDIDVQVSYAAKVGKTKAIRDLVPVADTDKAKRDLMKSNKKSPPNFKNATPFVSQNPNALPQQEDAVWQKAILNKSANTVVEPEVNIDGIVSFSVVPHDPSGDVGLNYYLQAVNATRLGVFDKTGNLIQSFNANTIWSSIGFLSGGDPIILYDQEYNRWLMTEFPSGNELLIAVSDSEDPLGGWTAYNFATPNFPDYPKYGIWNDALVVTTNESGSGALPCYFVNREALMAGESNVQIQRIVLNGIFGGPGLQIATPVDWSGLNPPKDNEPIVLSLGDDAWDSSIDDRIQLHSFNLDWNNSNNTNYTTTTINLSPFDTEPCSTPNNGGGFACIPQPDGATGLNGMIQVIMNQVHYRNFNTHEAIVLNFVVDATGGDNVAGIRWVELRRIIGGNWELYQEGTFAPDDGLNRFMGAICMDGLGNIGLAYGCGGLDEYIGLRFTGRRASDPLGEMTIQEYTLKPGQSAFENSTRYGDYHHMSIDPADDRTFWFTGEYAGNGSMNTNVAAFKLLRDTIDIGGYALLSPENADDLTAEENLTIEVINWGVETQTAYKVGYIFDGQAPVISETITTPIATEETYIHQFTETVDMSEVGDYEIKIFTQLEADLAYLNDTVRVIARKLPRFDVGVTAVNGLEEIVCNSSEVAVEFELTNFATEAVTSAYITVIVNGVTQTEFIWEGDLAANGTILIPLEIIDLIDGNNSIEIIASFPNFTPDERPENNAFETSVKATPSSGQVVNFDLLTDDYPGETYWTLTDENGDILYSGGPYQNQATLYSEEWCLNSDKCYTFYIQDAYGDGICCDWGQGNYQIKDVDGTLLVDGTGVFGEDNTDEFCTEFVCLLNADFDVSPETEENLGDGALVISANNGSGNLQYSIDGGTTFQTNNIFNGLSGGTYSILIVDENTTCQFIQSVAIETCALSYVVSVQNETFPNANDGQLEITAVGGTEPYQYSIDGGGSYQLSPIFTDLENGEYSVIVIDANSCIKTELVAVLELNTSNDLIDTYGQTIEVFPNPTTGLVTIHLNGYANSDIMLDFEVYDLSGKRIQNGQLVKYNETHKGQISLVAYPSGIYFVRFLNKDLKQLLKIVKD